MSGIQQTFTFPESVGGGTVTMRELNVETSIGVQEQYAKELSRAMEELVKRSLVSVNGAAVTSANRDEVWNGFNEKQRELCRRGWRHLHRPDEGDVRGFLESAQVVAG